MNIFSWFTKKLEGFRANPSPADFRRGKRNVRAIGILPDFNSRHIGSFKGGITPIKRRRYGVSLTAKRGG